MIDEATCQEIDKVIAKTLKDADFGEPPFFIYTDIQTVVPGKPAIIIGAE